MDDEIRNAIDISQLSDEQILELYNDVLEGGFEEFLAATCRFKYYCSPGGQAGYTYHSCDTANYTYYFGSAKCYATKM